MHRKGTDLVTGHMPSSILGENTQGNQCDVASTFKISKLATVSANCIADVHNDKFLIKYSRLDIIL